MSQVAIYDIGLKKCMLQNTFFDVYIFHVINLMTFVFMSYKFMTLVSKSQIHRPLPHVQGTTWDVMLTWRSLGKSRKCHKTEIWPIKAHKRGRLLKGHKHCCGDSFHLDPFSFLLFSAHIFLSQISLSFLKSTRPFFGKSAQAQLYFFLAIFSQISQGPATSPQHIQPMPSFTQYSPHCNQPTQFFSAINNCIIKQK